jgi:hypothetical protein
MTPALIPFAALRAFDAIGMTDEQITAVFDALDIRAIVSGALENEAIKHFQAIDRYKPLWVDVAAWPPMRVEFETAIVFGHIGESVAVAKSKSWGKVCLGLHPLEPEDQIHPERIIYILKSNNKMRQRWEWRDNLKRILNRDRRLVTEAMRRGQTAFLNWLSPDDERLLFSKLEMNGPKFWVAVRYGERAGENGFEAYFTRLQERTKGYTFDFEETLSL